LIRRQYQKIMTFFYDPFMDSLEKVLIKHRKFLIEKVSGGNVLEVGSGTGVNFSLYPNTANVYAIEPSVPMYKKSLTKLPENKNINVYNIGIEEVEKHAELPKQYDFILTTLVLCTISNPVKAANIYKKLLKPEGKLLVLEHIHSSGTTYGKFQKIINPIWRPFADGCNLTRRQDIILKEVGFTALQEKYFHIGTDWYRAVMVKN